MVDLKGQYNNIKNEIDSAIQDVINSTSFIKGKYVEEFQHNLERKFNVKNVICVGSGTDALRISLISLGLKPGDEIITSDFTFVATAEVAASIGCIPVLVDVDEDTFCMNVDSVKKAVTSKTKAIVPVHLFGQNYKLDEIKKIADDNGLFIIEDACQSINSKYTSNDGKVYYSGTFGNLGCTSFFPSKNLGCYGDGGAIFTDNDQLAQMATAVANHGMIERYHYEYIGCNSRLDAIQAAILNVKLKYLDDFTERRQLAAKRYDELFAECEGVTVPHRCENSTHVYHQYTLRFSSKELRDRAKLNLSDNGVPSMIYYPFPLHEQKPYMSDRYKNSDFSVSKKLSETVLSLPMHTELDSEQQLFIADIVKKSLK